MSKNLRPESSNMDKAIIKLETAHAMARVMSCDDFDSYSECLKVSYAHGLAETIQEAKNYLGVRSHF